jgi:hypothetical protein
MTNFSRYASVLSEGFTERDAIPPLYDKPILVDGFSDTYWRQIAREKKAAGEKFDIKEVGVRNPQG